MAESAAGNIGIQLVEEDESPLNSTINTTPLVDIMLVMLIIFLITVPVVVGTVEVQLPEERNKAIEVKPENVYLFVDGPGNVYWNTYRLPNDQDLASRLAESARRVPQPEVHISGDVNTEYLNVGKVVEMVQKAGILRIAFITKKPPGA